MRGAPQSRFAQLISPMSVRSSIETSGLPTRLRDRRRQYARKPARCQRMIVSGLTIAIALRTEGNQRQSQTNRKRSVLLRCGRFDARRRSTLICCRATPRPRVIRGAGWQNCRQQACSDALSRAGDAPCADLLQSAGRWRNGASAPRRGSGIAASQHRPNAEAPRRARPTHPRDRGAAWLHRQAARRCRAPREPLLADVPQRLLDRRPVLLLHLTQITAVLALTANKLAT
jgi:hypothetical protein